MLTVLKLSKSHLAPFLHSLSPPQSPPPPPTPSLPFPPTILHPSPLPSPPPLSHPFPLHLLPLPLTPPPSLDERQGRLCSLPVAMCGGGRTLPPSHFTGEQRGKGQRRTHPERDSSIGACLLQQTCKCSSVQVCER